MCTVLEVKIKASICQKFTICEGTESVARLPESN